MDRIFDNAPIMLVLLRERITQVLDGKYHMMRYRFHCI